MDKLLTTGDKVRDLIITLRSLIDFAEEFLKEEDKANHVIILGACDIVYKRLVALHAIEKDVSDLKKEF